MFVKRQGERGEPDDRVVLVHGIGSGHEVWDDMTPELARHHELLSVDLPGFGESPPLPESQRTLTGLADAIEAEMDREGWKRAHLVGHSMGGWLVLELAARGRALRTVAISPVGGATPEEAKRSRRPLVADRRAAQFAEHLPDFVLRGVFSTGIVRRLAVRNQMTRGEVVSPERLIRAMRTMGRAESYDEMITQISGDRDLIERNTERFGGISSPLLLIWGSEDRILPAAGGARLKAAIPGAELHEMPGVGHAPHFDHPEQLTRLVADFIAAR
ncbi:MAG: alpha/beta hydrolase [Solirubrobacterales bacterium]|nr:alpha/beta hydrolase [Solirubrobacterales bacterium]